MEELRKAPEPIPPRGEEVDPEVLRLVENPTTIRGFSPRIAGSMKREEGKLAGGGAKPFL